MKTNLLVSIILITIVLLTCLTCTPPPDHKIITPPAGQSDLALLVQGNNAFAFDAYQTLKEDGNLFYSPYSISLALAMTYVGARDTTEQQMADTLHFTLPQEKLHPTFHSLATELSQRGQVATENDSQPFKLNIVNAIWGQQDFTFLQDFLDTLTQNYGAGINKLDFRGAPEPSRITINNWVSDQTQGRIKDLIPRGAIDPLTALVLTNAIYFKAAWEFPFREASTSDDVFHLLNGSEVSGPMMYQTEYFKYAEDNGYQAVELPYNGAQISMLVLLPKSGRFPSFEDSLNSTKVDEIIQNLSTERISLTMPKYEFSSSFELKSPLSDMGMPLAFTPPILPSAECSKDFANFSGMDGKCDLSITRVIHQAFVSVDEAGTEAAAATAVVVAPTAMPAQPTEFKIDRPFIFLIRDIQTGTILFIGRVMDPSK